MDTLPPEIYWNIFMINTERGDEPLTSLTVIAPESDHRLDTARHCSQVCRLWRTLLLQFSSVWGRLLHLQNLEHTTDAWMEVVASRIGEASLWITGYVTDSTRPFIFAILEEKWQNVQVLEIWDESLYSNKVLPTWSFLEREAPNLEEFQLSKNTRNDFERTARRILPFSPLFRNRAPRLKRFTLWEPFHFSLPTPWMANLHSVTFFRPRNGPLVLSALKSMPLLRELYVTGGNTLQPMFPAQDGGFDKPHLPLLESLILDDFYHLMDMIILLESITLAPGQRSLRTLFMPQVYKEDHQRVHRAITKWIYAYMSASPPRHLSLDEYDQVLTIQDIRVIGEGMQVHIAHDDTQSHVTIEAIVASLRYSVVEKLDVVLRDSAPAWPLRPLFEALHSVTRLEADGSYTLFDDILQFSLFPNLHTVNVLNADETMILPTVIHFLEQRVLTGSPISVLYLSSFPFSDASSWFSDTIKERLSKIPDLSVIVPEDSEF
ncbi:hypothetical protein D9613_011874 [Agrocybe pediades]|uniref:F-box domain-containing protein n=1 Tax=Agrocybe pediades TaxID=84607 RepID=A0A8H4QL80_9AGAR|nr:hypothetical protein D9613_011874 [Agrocybe pediades]